MEIAKRSIMYQVPNITKENLYKTFISIVLGLIGLCLNIRPFVFLLPPHEIKFMTGLVCPMIVSLRWGWRYGLLSAIFCLAFSTTWIKDGGILSLVTVLMFILWIVWHGWCAKKFGNTGDKKWNPYLFEIPFRLFNTLILYIIFRWAFQFNSPVWSSKMSVTSISLSFINVTAIQAVVNGYLILLLSDVLILFGPIRKILGLKEITEQKRSNYLLGAAVLICCVFWVIDGVFNLIFQNFSHSITPRGTQSLLDSIIFKVPPYALFERLSFFIALLTGVILSTRYIGKYTSSEKLLQKIVKLSPYPITVVDSGGRVEYINPEFVGSFGYRLEDIPTVTDWYNKIFPNIFERRDFIAHWKEDMQKAKQLNREPRMFNVTNKNGNIENIIFRQVILDEDKEYIICENVSERIRAEEKFRKLNEELEQRVKKRTAQLEATNRELEAFSYSVSHDLRAPLRSIDGFSLALLEEYNHQLDAEGKDYLNRVRSASQRMGQIIDDLLSLSRISRRELKKEKVNLSEMAERIVSKLQERDPDRSVDIVIGHKVSAVCDPNLIEVVLENLLSNAWKFTSMQEKAWIVFDTVLQDDELVYCVRDNGVGFDMAYAGKLFGAFQRLHKDADFEGFGIGLATVMRIINRHEGRIWAEGYVNRGATFYFAL